MALASSTRPLLASLSNKDASILDDDIFNQFIDADEFDFSDSSYDRSTQADVSDRDSWFDEPYTGGAEDLTGHLPSLSPFESDNKTFVLDEQDLAAGAVADPLLDAQEAAGLSTPLRADPGIRKIPSTVKTARRSQSYGVRKSPHRRADSSPTMPQQTSCRTTNKDGRRHRDGKALQSPPPSHFDPLSPLATVTQNRYVDANQPAHPQSRYREPAFAVSPLSQQFPSQQQSTMPYYTPLASPQFNTGQTIAYNQPQPMSSFFPSLDLDIDQYLVAAPPPTSTLNPPTFSNPFPPEADMAWEHDLGSLPNDFGFPSLSSMPSAGMSSPTHSNMPLFNDSKVQSWAPPLYPSAPHTAPLMSTQQQYYDYGSAAAFPTHHYQPLQNYQNQPVPHSAHPASNGFASHTFPNTHPQAFPTHDPIGMSGMSFINHTHTQPPPVQLLSVPKTRRGDRTRTHTPEPQDSRRSQSRPVSRAQSIARPSSKARSKGKGRAKSRSRAHSSSGLDSEDSLSDDALMAHYDDIGGSDDDEGDDSDSDDADRRRRQRDRDARKDKSKDKGKGKSTRSGTIGTSAQSSTAAPPPPPRSPSHARSRSQARHTSRHAPSTHHSRRDPSLPLSPISPVSQPVKTRKPRTTNPNTKSKSKSKSKAGGKGGNDPFVNLTAEDHKKILTGVAPSGGSKTKAKREREEMERREELERRLRSLGGG